MKGIVRA